VNVVVEAYRKHVVVRAVLDIVAKPLNVEQTSALVESLKTPPRGDGGLSC
jgi:aconitate hydratase 2/2-methylisocitrate dehydratase